MIKKVLGIIVTCAAVAIMGVSSAQANTLDSVSGDVKLLFDGFDSASLYSTAVPGVLCASVAACDAVSLGGADAPGSSKANDSWGFADISSIKNIGAFVNAWNAGDDGDFLIAYFHGFNDLKVEVLNAASTDIFSVGGTVDIYRVDFTFRSVTFDPSTQAALEASLGAMSKYLSLTFLPGCSASVAAATLCGNFDLDNLQGSSNGLALATGGDALAKYPFDFQFEQSVEPCDASCAGSSFNLLLRSGSALTTALPEPAPLALLGGLSLTLGSRRRKI